MPTAYLTTKGLKVTLTGERLEVILPLGSDDFFPQQKWIPLIDVEQVVVDAGIHLSTSALSKLLQKQIPVLFLSQGHFPCGIATPYRRQVLCLGQQIDASRDENFRLRNARLLVVAKILNMKRVLQRLSSNRKQPAIAASWLNSMANQASAAASTDSLRGLEGAATGRYFETLNQYFPSNMPFDRRSRQPPHNATNALLSYLYTILAGEFTVHLLGCGLEPGWGLYHESEDGRPSLALDLMEPYRAPLVDALVLDLLNHHRITSSDFHLSESGIILKRESRRTLFVAWEDRLEREFFYEKAGHRTTLRQQIKDSCQDVKRAFRERSEITPFKMN